MVILIASVPGVVSASAFRQILKTALFQISVSGFLRNMTNF